MKNQLALLLRMGLSVCAILCALPSSGRALAAPAAAHSGENPASNRTAALGGLLGISGVNKDIGTGVAFGLEGSYFFSAPWGAGFFLRAGNHSQDITSFFWGGNILYRFQDLIPGLSVGGTLGSGRFSSSGLTGNSSLSYGLKGNYQIGISKSYPVTAGLDVTLQFLKPGTELLTVFSPMLSLNWWL